MALGMDLCDAGMDFGSILASEIDEKRDRFRESFLKILWRGPAEINSLGESPSEVGNLVFGRPRGDTEGSRFSTTPF